MVVVDFVIPAAGGDKWSASVRLTLPIVPTEYIIFFELDYGYLQQSLRQEVSYGSASLKGQEQTHLVSVAPEEVLGADVLVRILSSLLQRRQVRPVLPMLVPQDIGVQASNDQAREGHAVKVSISVSPVQFTSLGPRSGGSLTRVTAYARVLGNERSASISPQASSRVRTTCASGVILHGLPLAVESIVLGTVEGRALGALESALEGLADSRRADLRRKALRGTQHGSLREHCVVVLWWFNCSRDFRGFDVDRTYGTGSSDHPP